MTLNLGSISPQFLNANLTLTLTSGSGIQECIGTTQQDVITAGLNNGCTIHGGGGNDILSGAPGYSSSLYADSGGCYLYATGQNMYLDGGTDNVTFVFDADNPLGSDTVKPGTGNDVLDFSPTKTDGITLNLGITTPQVLNNNLTLTLLSGSIAGAIGTGGTDTITAGLAPATLLRAGTGNSTLITRSGRYNTVYGGSGTTTVIDDGGTDYFTSGTGSNTFDFDVNNPLGSVVINDNVGTNTLDFSSTQHTSITLNLGRTNQQQVNANLTLSLTSVSGIHECIGTSYGTDVLTASADPGCILLPGGSALAGNDTFLPYTTEVQFWTNWIEEYANARGVPLTAATIPQLVLGAIRGMYLQATIEAYADGTTVLDLLNGNPTQPYWDLCYSTTQLMMTVLNVFGIQTQAVCLWHTLTDGHVTLEYYSTVFNKWVWVEPIVWRSAHELGWRPSQH